MLALQITGTKDFMGQLLAGETFDSFLLEEAQIDTAISYQIDGHVNMDFYEAEERTKEAHPYEFLPWSEAKAICYQMIKGHRTPLLCKLVLQLKSDSAESMLRKFSPDGDFSVVKALLLMVKYDEHGVVLTTGTSYHTFTMDREAERIWDRAICQYLTGKGLSYEVL